MKIKAVLQFNQSREAWELAFTDSSVKIYLPPIEQQVNSLWWPFYAELPPWIRNLGPSPFEKLPVEVPSGFLAQQGLIVVPNGSKG